MQEVMKFDRCAVYQDKHLNYVVMSNNNICLLHVGSAVGAIKYAEWFNSKK